MAIGPELHAKTGADQRPADPTLSAGVSLRIMKHTTAVGHSRQLGSQPALYVDFRVNATRESHRSTSGPRKLRCITMARAFNPITWPGGVTALISVSVPLRLTGLFAPEVAPQGVRGRGDGPVAFPPGGVPGTPYAIPTSSGDTSSGERVPGTPYAIPHEFRGHTSSGDTIHEFREFRGHHTQFPASASSGDTRVPGTPYAIPGVSPYELCMVSPELLKAGIILI